MHRLLLVGLQVSGAGDQSGAPPPAPLDLHLVQRCGESGQDGDVVVCGGRDPDRYRLKPMPSRFDRRDGLGKAELSVGGGKLAATTQQVMIGGVPSNRVMISLKLPF